MHNKHIHLLFAVVAGFAGSFIALALIVATSGVWAQQGLIPNSVPKTISYQGYLTDASDQPISGTVSMDFALYDSASGGTPLWEETQSSVAVSNGFFTVLLGSVEPLGVDLFSEPERYLGVTVDTGSGPTELPRQVLASVPFAFQAQAAVSATLALRAQEALSAETALRAQEALSATRALSTTAAPWSGLEGVPSDISDGDDVGGDYANVITVAQSGGDYTSVAEALASITDASDTNRYLVWVAPGVYNETQTSVVDGYVHLQGAGPNVTKITGAFTGGQSPTSAVVQLDDNGRVSDIAIDNTGTSQISYGIFSSGSGDQTTIDNVYVTVTGSGGTGHFALWTADSDLRASNSYFEASGAATTNAAVGATDTGGVIEKPLISHSILRSSGGGYALYAFGSSPIVTYSELSGSNVAIAQANGGTIEVRNSEVFGFNDYAEIQSGNGSIQLGGSLLRGGFDEGTGTITCAQVWNGSYTASDSTCPTIVVQ